MRRSKTQKMVGVSMLAAIGYLLMFLEFPVIPIFPFLTVDFSDIPVLIGTFIYGPFSGVMIAFVRAIIHFITTGPGLIKLVGDTTGFIASIAFVLPTYYFIRKSNQKSRMFLSLIAGILSLTVTMCVANYFVSMPLYIKIFNFNIGMPLEKYILVGVLPFNLLKGSLVSLVFIAIHGKLLPWFQKRNLFIEEETLSKDK